jgi:ribosomal protein S18 acetylase RimI-like enzyme
LPGDVFAAPYAALEPSLAFVAEDTAGVGGYIVGALDSILFRQRLERAWWPAVRARYPEPPPDVAEKLSLPEQHALHDLHRPWDTDVELAERYPSHLHINLLPQLQGRGLGRKLLEALTSELRAQRSRGVHLLVSHRNQPAAAFYGHVGFTELAATDVRVFAMDLSDRQA